MFGGTLHGESWPELYPPPPGSQRISVGGFVEGTQSSTFLLVTVDQEISPCQLASGTLGSRTPSLCCDRSHSLLEGVKAFILHPGHWLPGHTHPATCCHHIFSNVAPGPQDSQGFFTLLLLTSTPDPCSTTGRLGWALRS